jgi:hypothetical protein
VYVRPFSLSNRTFDSDVIDLPVIIVALSLGVKINIGASVIVRIVPWVGKVSACCGDSWI